MALPARQVVLYAATSVDYAIAFGAASAANLVSGQVTSDYWTAYAMVQSGQMLVIAVGGMANDALYYNPCGWKNPDHPSGGGAGSTPFTFATPPLASLPGANYYENAAGADRVGTLKLAQMLAYYAQNAAYPPGYGSLPSAVSPANTCSSSALDPATMPC